MGLMLYLLEPGADKFSACLPADVKLDEVVSVQAPDSSDPNQAKSAKSLTVQDVLTKLKAYCKKGELVDGKGKPIYFYRLIGCWGNPPDDYQEQLERQAKKLEELRKKYTVIEILCALNPSQRI